MSTVLMVHGFRGNRFVFSQLATLLELRGHNTAFIEYGTDMSAQQIADKKIKPFMDKNPEAHVIGFSAGGYIVRKAAQIKGLINKSVVLVAPALFGSPLANARLFLNKIPGFGKWKDPLLEDLAVGNPEHAKLGKMNVGRLAIIRGRGKEDAGIIGNIVKRVVGDNDGSIPVWSTYLPENEMITSYPMNHMELLKNNKVNDKIVEFIENE